MNIAAMKCYLMSCPVNEGEKPIKGKRQMMKGIEKDFVEYYGAIILLSR